MDIKERIKIIENDEDIPKEYVLHKLLELAVSVTGRGHVSDDYTKFIEFDIGNITIFSDPYYNRVQIDEQDLESKSIQKLIKEVKKRLLQFDEKIKSTRERFAYDIFDGPINGFEDKILKLTHIAGPMVCDHFFYGPLVGSCDRLTF